MPLFTTPDGRYTVAWETPGAVAKGDADGNSVIYDRGAALEVPWPGTPIWDRFSYEAGLGTGPVVPPPVVASPPVPAPVTPPPLPQAPRIIPVTDASDGDFVPRMYSYWSNAWVTGNRAFVFAGHADGSPRFFDVNLTTGVVDRLGPTIGFVGTTEGWYWDAHGGIYLLDGSRLMSVSPFTNEARIVFDIAESHPGCLLWQAHSSDDGQVHAATVKQRVSDGPYPALGTVVHYRGTQLYFPAQGTLDESQIDATGTILVIKETLEDGLSNRIINLSTRFTQTLRKADGAVGHSDMGPMSLVGEWSPPPGPDHGQIVQWDLNQPLTPGRRLELLPTWNAGHLSIRGGRCLRSHSGGLSLLALDGSGETPLLALTVPDDYDHQLKANLDPSGRVACYMLDTGGRYDVFLAVLP